MDPIKNPYSPGAGSPPPELAGRGELLEKVRIALARIKDGRGAKSVLMVGLRGVGKTVLLDRMRGDAEGVGIHTIRVEAPENRSLPGLIAPELRTALLRLSRNERAKDRAERAMRALAGFANALKVKYGDIQVGFDFKPEPGLADNGDLATDLQSLMEVSGEAAREANTALAMFIDELQYVEEEQLAALITALHRMAQRQLPVVLVGAGLPNLLVRTGNAKSYAERLFDFPEVGPLTEEASGIAIARPAQNGGVVIEDAALTRIFRETRGYPYFLQEWGKHTWDVADDSPITVHDVASATAIATAALDASFFRVRLDRVTTAERKYLRAMAARGYGPHRSGDIANELGREVTSLAPIRSQLISKGMIWSPSHGETAFTVPLFDEFLRRVMPGNDWRN